jgi:hypothetical protein
MKSALRALGVFALIVGGPGAAQAGIVTYSLSGTVSVFTDTSSNHFVPTSIQPNISTFVGTFSFDNSAPGQISGSDAFYRGRALNLSANITIDGVYNYSLNSPSDQDEIDILGASSFGLYLRGPTVFTNFAPNPPFSHFEFIGKTNTNILSLATISPNGGTAGVSDQQTPGMPYWFIGSNVTSVAAVPEPSTFALVGVLASAFYMRRLMGRDSSLPRKVQA